MTVDQDIREIVREEIRSAFTLGVGVAGDYESQLARDASEALIYQCVASVLYTANYFLQHADFCPSRHDRRVSTACHCAAGETDRGGEGGA